MKIIDALNPDIKYIETSRREGFVIGKKKDKSTDFLYIFKSDKHLIEGDYIYIFTTWESCNSWLAGVMYARQESNKEINKLLSLTERNQMTVKELRKLLQGAKPDAQIVVHVNQRKAYRIGSVVHTNHFDEKGNPIQLIDIRLKVERK